jgi:hypothetical protein
MRSTEYGWAIMITNRIHISAPDYQNDKNLGILNNLVKLFICPMGVPLGGTGQKLFVLHVILLVLP